MVTREQSLQRFLDKADEVINGKYLFAIKKIEEMLVTISTSRILFEVFEFCCATEDAEQLKARCMVKTDGAGRFVMPDGKKQIIALCFYVLKDITSGEIDFNSFLTTYFPSDESFLDSYGKFINFLVLPFRNTVNNVVETVICASNIKESRESIAKKPDIDNLYLLGLSTFLEEDLRALVALESKDAVVCDLLCELEAMIKQAREYRTESLKPLFIAYKYAVMHVKRVKTHYEEVEEMLADHGII
jgi:hypothetical protein